MNNAKRRGKWWIVSIHLLASAIVFPLLAALVVGATLAATGLSELQADALRFGSSLLTYIGGTYYSVMNLRNTAVTEDWVGCTMPAVLVFASIHLGWPMAWWLCGSATLSGIAFNLGFSGVIVLAFAAITSTGFRRIQRQQSIAPAVALT